MIRLFDNCTTSRITSLVSLPILGSLVVVGVMLSQSKDLPTPQLISNLGAASPLQVDALAVNSVGNEAVVVIRGDLSSVNWRDYLGENITIEGDLVINDTYDLARRGQVTVARSRLFIPTSQVDPNDQMLLDNPLTAVITLTKLLAFRN